MGSYIQSTGDKPFARSKSQSIRTRGVGGGLRLCAPAPRRESVFSFLPGVKRSFVQWVASGNFFRGSPNFWEWFPSGDQGPEERKSQPVRVDDQRDTMAQVPGLTFDALKRRLRLVYYFLCVKSKGSFSAVDLILFHFMS